MSIGQSEAVDCCDAPRFPATITWAATVESNGPDGGPLPIHFDTKHIGNSLSVCKDMGKIA